jgi:uncharacterized protein
MHTFRSSSTSTARRYRITQLAFVQEHALGEAQNRIKRLEWEVQRAQQASQQKSGSSSGGGFLSGLFGGDARQQQSGPPPDSDARNQGQPQGQGYYPQSAPPRRSIPRAISRASSNARVLAS